MADIIEMIQLSPTMEEGKLVAWLKKEGDKVATGDLIAEVETDKATMEMESFFDGTILKILAPAGTSARVGMKLAIIGKPGEDISGLIGDAPAAGATPAADAAPAADVAQAPAPAVAQATDVSPAPAATPPASAASQRHLSSPLARKVASDLGVNITEVAGSGPAGRVVKRDVDAAAAAPKPAPAAAGTTTPSAPAVIGSGRRVELSPMRKAIARNLTAAWQAPSFTITRDVAMDATTALRAQVNADLAATGSKLKLSVNDFVLRAVALALVDVPEMNAAFDGDAIKLFDSVDIGMAVALDGGLITPIVRQAHKKSIATIATEARELATRARDKKLKPEEFTGSTFSVSNLGMFGIDHFTAVLNPPAAGILAVGAVVRKPVVLSDNTLGIGDRMSVTLTADHRAVDGALAATWMQKLVSYLEHPTLLLV
jgi:pyruvate dehydrogenase E2 component (dihydrolipoamide acetyltransferase)